MARFLIIGGAGYIGSHVAKLLDERHHNVIIFDDFSTGHWASMPYDTEACFSRLKYLSHIDNIDCAMHFGAFSIVPESIKNPKKYYNNNIKGTLSYLNFLLKKKINKIIFSSSAAVYGDNQTNCAFDENSPTNPINPYGRTKLMIEQILSDYDTAYGIKSICLRYFNAAGADPSGTIGEDHDPETHLIPNILKVPLGQKEGINIFGTDYPTPDGTCIRDYIHVNDLAEAHLLAATKLLDGGESSIYNLGSEKGTSVREIVDIAKKVTKFYIPIIESPRRSGDPVYLLASSQKIKSELSWKPRYDDPEIIIETAWNWHKNNPKGYK